MLANSDWIIPYEIEREADNLTCSDNNCESGTTYMTLIYYVVQLLFSNDIAMRSTLQVVVGIIAGLALALFLQPMLVIEVISLI